MTEESEVSEHDIVALRDKIIHLLRIYPVISPTMLQGGLGPYIKPKVWRPILEDLINEGLIEQRQETHLSPGGRYNVHSMIQLVNK